ncbi:MAG: carotenoid 1,2-hydratase [Caldimonas sp.]
MFSPYYASARRSAGPRGADPFDHCALNVSLYRRGGAKRWTMTERGRRQVRCSAAALQIGTSGVHWAADGTLEFDLDEISVPWPARVRGCVRVRPLHLVDRSFALDPEGLHAWRPLAPLARIEVALQQPALRWSGTAYLDSNFGQAPLEQTFESWHWSRASMPERRCAVLYDVRRKDGSELAMSLRFGADGTVDETASAPPVARMASTPWRIERQTRCEPGHRPAIDRTLEDGPFYARSLFTTQLDGARIAGFHESLSLRRFESRWVQRMLPFRMPRQSGLRRG